VAQALAEAGVNIRAMSVSDTVDHAVVRLVPTDPALARDVLEKNGALVVETDVLLVPLADKPGELAAAAASLAEADVNIEYLYGSVSSGQSKGTLVVRVSDMDRATKALA
jgi:hypothetical protein